MSVTELTTLEERSRWNGNAFGSFFNSDLLKNDSGSNLDSELNNKGIRMNPTPMLSEQEDPSILQAAREIYQTYYTVHPEVTALPLGVAIDRTSYRGKLIFKQKPALLPKECFILLSSIDIR